MRKPLLALALGSLLCCGIATAPAQDNPQPQQDGQYSRGPGGGPGGGQGRANPDRQLERLTGELGLSSDQQAQIRPILVDRQQKTQALFQNQSLSEQDRRQQMRAISEASRAATRAVLTDDQKQKFDAIQDQRGRRGGRQGRQGQPEEQSPPEGQAPPQPQQ
ncbi:MAG TPA: hypothetical protein VE291_11435 [Terracidiphilus sp.]|jgi:hypothetical protein|nr:hypothetical protein [Terracidiphilus sp.]